MCQKCFVYKKEIECPKAALTLTCCCRGIAHTLPESGHGSFAVLRSVIVCMLTCRVRRHGFSLHTVSHDTCKTGTDTCCGSRKQSTYLQKIKALIFLRHNLYLCELPWTVKPPLCLHADHPAMPQEHQVKDWFSEPVLTGHHWTCHKLLTPCLPTSWLPQPEVLAFAWNSLQHMCCDKPGHSLSSCF